MKIHFIAIGGSAMHNLAIALSRKGFHVTGSDDEIFEPSKSRLKREGILPKSTGWDAERVTSNLDAVVLGMHARADNPELAAAEELGIPIYSYPEYVFEQTKNKTRVVIGGSHGKTTITSMILHVLGKLNMDVDYLVGAQLEGYDCMVKLSESSSIAILEGDEYLSSPIDRRPKFHLYKPHIALLTGVAWDHINVFPTFENYLEQFEVFVDLIEPNGKLIYFEGDEYLRNIAAEAKPGLNVLPYHTHPHSIEQGQTFLKADGNKIPVQIFGAHNLQNLNGAIEVLRALDIPDESIYESLADFKGASKRLECVRETPEFIFYKDFAHAPSKLKATTEALKIQYPDRELVACMELHTFSSLSKDFLPLYDGAMGAADFALVYYSPKVVAHKKLDPISEVEVLEAFGTKNLEVFTETEQLLNRIKSFDWKGKTLLMMSSGNFGGIDFEVLAEELI